MKLTAIIRKLFKRNKELSISEMMERSDSKPWIYTVSGHTFHVMYSVSDMDNGFKTIKDGFKTKTACKEFCKTLSNVNCYITPYVVEI